MQLSHSGPLATEQAAGDLPGVGAHHHRPLPGGPPGVPGPAVRRDLPPHHAGGGGGELNVKSLIGNVAAGECNPIAWSSTDSDRTEFHEDTTWSVR